MSTHNTYRAVCFCGNKSEWLGDSNEDAIKIAVEKFKLGLFYVDCNSIATLIWVNPNAPHDLIAALLEGVTTV